MSDTEAEITLLVDGELARIREPAQRSRLQGLLRRPARLSLAWDYGEADERFDCWQVGQSPDGRLLLVYCGRGFGPSDPWGFVFADEGAMGMDSQWHSGLEDAAIGAGLLPAPAGYEVPGPRPSGGVG
ncbi:MAG TPA: hypothetical protein VFB66_14610 [Tepidisphaeraceae bacterium]|nr:hypothetical protein [Tepidisphaeraceae bacterium]